MRIERTFRGISKRLAIHYLQGLGGRPLDAAGRPVADAGETGAAAERVDRVVADEWTVRLSTATVTIGPNLEVTEVELVFEGDDASLEEVVADFAWKARRAGG